VAQDRTDDVSVTPEPDRQSDHGEPADRLTVRALARGLSILGLFDVDNQEWTIDEMAEQTGLLRMTVYRMVRTLEAEGFLARDRASNRYHLGPSTLAMIYVSEDQTEFIRVARPFLESLYAATGESVTLAVEVDGAPVCIDMINSTRPFKRQTALGRVIGNVASVQGKVFAAFKPAEEKAAIAHSQHRKLTAQTETDPQRIMEELDRVAAEDMAYDLEGMYPSTCAVAAPVRDQIGDVVACISVVMPTGRFGPEEQELCAGAVRDTASALSAYLGWNPSTPTLETLELGPNSSSGPSQNR
jgi:DNA-binding IclR family transcriptional regulator